MKKLLLLTMVFLALALTAEARTRHHSYYNSYSYAPARGNTAVMAYTLAGCPDCAAFKQYLHGAGVQLLTSYTRNRDVSLFPTVLYSDGSSDHGERVYSGQVRLPHALKVVETD